MFQFQVAAVERLRLKTLAERQDRPISTLVRRALARAETVAESGLAALRRRRAVVKPGIMEGPNVKIRCSPEEKQRWESHARRLALSAGAFARLALFIPSPA